MHTHPTAVASLEQAEKRDARRFFVTAEDLRPRPSRHGPNPFWRACSASSGRLKQQVKLGRPAVMASAAQEEVQAARARRLPKGGSEPVW